MADVFVSYKAEDRRRVRPLVEAVEAEGLSVWWDAQIGGGDEWRQSIERELESAKCVLVVWSKRSTQPEGRFVRDEASRAMERGVYLPVRIDNVRLPLGFGETQALALTGWKASREDARYKAVLAAVRATVAGKRPGSGRDHVETRLNRRRMITGSAVAAAAVAGAGGWALLKPSGGSAAGSIAVLPFANLSGDPRQAYFSDGIAEELRNALTRLAGLKVAGRISSEAVRNEDARTAARKLRVANVLTGSVRESPSTIRISAELIDGRTGLDRWAEDYDRSPGDSIVIQTDIAENVATSLAAALGSAARAAIAVGGTTNAAAQKLIIEARAIAREGTQAARQHALELAGSAISLDPGYADAYAQKSIMLGAYANNFAIGSAEIASDRAEAMRLAQKAIRIAPRLARAHAAVAQLDQSNLDMARAANEFERAVQLAPGDADIVGRYVYLLARLGKPSQALKAADNVISLDPLNHFSYENRVSALYDLRRYQQAIDYCDQVRRKSRELFKAQGLYADCLLMAGRVEEARRTYALLNRDSWQQLNGETLALVRAGDRPRAMQTLARYQRLFGEASSYQYAGIYAQLGDRPAALAALEHAWAIRDGGLVSIKIDPLLDPIRREARFATVVSKMNFPA
jgi:TolB-like protein/Tfp pilus assembly protein PilF